jgi:hypothetical protein
MGRSDMTRCNVRRNQLLIIAVVLLVRRQLAFSPSYNARTMVGRETAFKCFFHIALVDAIAQKT